MNAETCPRIPFGLTIQDWSSLPHGPEWVKQRKPKTHIVVRTRTVRLSDGTTQRFFVLRERPTDKRALRALQTEINALKREVRQARIRATDRALLAAKNAANGIRPRRKKAKR